MYDTIELIITVDGKRYPFRRPLPYVVKASEGRMSMVSAVKPTTIAMLFEAMDQLIDQAVIVLDNNLPHPRKVQWDKGQARCELGNDLSDHGDGKA